MMWGCMTYFGVGYGCQVYDGVMKSEDYINILETTLKESLKYYEIKEDAFIFQHDNDPKHSSKATGKYLQDAKIQVLPWPSQSPDLNPIEHIWQYLKVKIGLRKRRPTSIHDLLEVVKEEWNKIPPDLCRRLIETMPDRIQKVIKAKGGSTRY